MEFSIHLALAFAVPLLITLAITPSVIRLAHLIGAIDRPGARKAHSTPTPRLGGVAVSIAFGCSVLVVMYFDPVLFFPPWAMGSQGLTLAISLILVVLLGVWDDIRELRAKQKFIVQLLLSSIVYLAGFHVSGITDPFGGGKLDLGAFDYLVTVLWIVGVTNAVNLIDGLDGLASGVSAIALLTMVPIAIMHDDPGTAVV
ncbi:partial putative undecaprenyl-phosphate N-acetylglucosaminyl 1-phosphate transferase, partial [Anaerolineae bacterium]